MLMIKIMIMIIIKILMINNRSEKSFPILLEKYYFFNKLQNNFLFPKQ